MVTVKVKQNGEGLLTGETYEVEHISMGQSRTSVQLKEPKEGTFNPFNSILFDFYEDAEELDIFSDARFNPYL